MAEFDCGLVWFRRDLRVTDHTALYHALTRCRRVYCIFIFEKSLLAPLPADDRRLAFIHASLIELDAHLRAAGGALLVRHGDSTQEIPAIARAIKAQAVFSQHDYEPAAIARDAEVEGADGLGQTR